VLTKRKPSQSGKTLEKKDISMKQNYTIKNGGFIFDAKKMVIDDVSKEQIWNHQS
tara:strand:+ start:26 stop:190 length:165 start_codon:yes stop_codon:yes gene_type:complete